MSTTAGSDPTVAPERVAERLGDEDLFLLDVRNEDDYEEWHLPGTHNVPIYDELLEEEYDGLADALDEIPRDREVVVVCVAGITSARAAAFLRERGYDARSMADGMRGWGTLHLVEDVDGVAGVTRIVRPGTGCVSYLVHDGDEGVVVDPSVYADEYRRVAADRDVDVVATLDTHAHADHLSGAPVLAADLGVAYHLHPADAGERDDVTPIRDGDAVAVGDRSLAVRHTPGHTTGSVVLQWGDALLSGDTLFVDGVGRPDLEGGADVDVREAAGDLFDSLAALKDLPAETAVLPGHYADAQAVEIQRATTIGRLEADNELFAMDDRERFVEAVIERLPDEPANYNRIKAINRGEESMDDDARSLELGPNNCAAG